MAEGKAFFGSAWGVPVHGTVISLTAADVNSILSAASGLAKALFLIGGLALSLAFATVGLFALIPPKRQSMPWGTLANVETWNTSKGLIFERRHIKRRFSGVCMTKEVQINSDGHEFTIPVDYIKSYRNYSIQSGFIRKRTTVFVTLELFDESEYHGHLLFPSNFDFLTPLGKQTIPVEIPHSIDGCTVAEAEKLRRNVDQFLQNESATAEEFLGADNFYRFFMRY